MTLVGAVIGIMVAFFVGYLGIAVTIADDGAREFGFRFFRPRPRQLLSGFNRVHL